MKTVCLSAGYRHPGYRVGSCCFRRLRITDSTCPAPVSGFSKGLGLRNSAQALSMLLPLTVDAGYYTEQASSLAFKLPLPRSPRPKCERKRTTDIADTTCSAPVDTTALQHTAIRKQKVGSHLSFASEKPVFRFQVEVEVRSKKSGATFLLLPKGSLQTVTSLNTY
jgi:hypothetical protein